MNDDRREENVGGPVMNGEDVEAAVGPESNGAVTDRDQKPKQNVGRRKEHRNQAYISTHVNQRDQIPILQFSNILNGAVSRRAELYSSLEENQRNAANALIAAL